MKGFKGDQVSCIPDVLLSLTFGPEEMDRLEYPWHSFGHGALVAYIIRLLCPHA